MGKWTELSPDLFSDRAAEAGNTVTERHQEQPQLRGIGSNEAASRIDTRGGHKHVLVICDRFTKLTRAIPLRDATALTVS